MKLLVCGIKIYMWYLNCILVCTTYYVVLRFIDIVLKIYRFIDQFDLYLTLLYLPVFDFLYLI